MTALIASFPLKPSFNLIKMRRPAVVLSLVLITIALALTFTRGLNLGIDFSGGLLVEIKTPEPADLGELRDRLPLPGATLQTFGAPNDILIRVQATPDQREDVVNTIKTNLAEYLGDAVDYRRIEYVGPSVGEALVKQGFIAVIFSLTAILIYIWLRFEWQFGIGALLALTHDVILTIGFFALTQLEFNLSTIAAILTIAGYSINDTVVVYDRIRENFRRYNKKPLKELLNVSLNETLTRTMLTSLTTLAALTALFIFGGEIIRGFSAALLFGVVIGTWSSLFVATPLLLALPVRPSDFNEDRDDRAMDGNTLL